MCCDEVCGCTFSLIIAGVFLVIGAPCWAVGASKPNFWTTNLLISLPIYPETEGGFGKYGAVEPTNATFYPDQEFYNISISTTDVADYLTNDLKVYLFHNLWGLNFSLDIVNNNNGIVISTTNFENNFNFRSNISDTSVIEDAQKIDEIAIDFAYYDYTYVYCPYPTLFTISKEIDPYCRDQIYPVKLNSHFSEIYLASIDFSYIYNITFHFNHLEAYPKNFIETPQIFIGGYSQTNRWDLIIAGIFFCACAIVLAIIVCIVSLFFMDTFDSFFD